MPGLTWTRVCVPEHYDRFGAIDLGKVFGPRQNCSAYVATRIEVKETNVYSMLAGGDDSLSLRCDGKLLVDDRHATCLTDTARPHLVRLEKGTHTLVARVSQQARWWQMLVRFRNADGTSTGNIVGLSMTPE